MVKLGDLFTISSGGTPSKNNPEYYENGTIPWIKTGDLKEKYVSKKIECISEKGLKNSSAKLFPRDTVLLAMYGATIGACSILPYEASTNQACAAFLPNDEVLPEYLYYFLSSRKESFIKDGVGGAQPNISAGYLKNVEFDYVDLDTQKNIIAVFNKVDKIMNSRKQQLLKLDEFIKSRFVELFGNAEHNEKGLPTLPMTDLCEIIDGDRGKDYPKQEEFSEEGFCLFLNAKNVTSNGFSFENCMYITEEKDKILRKGKLSRGDVVLTTRGTLGNLAYYDDSVPHEHMRINSGMVILRMKRDRITERFFIEQFKMQLASIKEKIASGSAQPQLPISTMNKIVMLVPDVELQHQFASFIEQTDKSKLAIQKSLEQLETLKKSLMQQYFG